MIVGLGLGITAAGHFVVSAVAEVIRSKKGIVAKGAADIDTAQSKFGGSSLFLDYNQNDTLEIADNYSDLKFGTSAFTIEGWFYPTEASASSQPGGSRFFYFRGVNNANGVLAGITTNGIIFRGPSATDLSYTTTITTWTHIAFVYDGTNKKIFVNGTEQASAAASLNVTLATTTNIGGLIADNRFNYKGYIDELRVSNTARYTANFTAPTAPFVNDENTLLLLHMDGTNGSTVFEDDNGTRKKFALAAVGNAQIDTAQSKFGGTSLLLDGSGDRLDMPGDDALVLSYTNWTVEYWIRLDAHQGAYTSSVAIWSDTTSNGSVYYFSPNIFDGTTKAGWQYFYTTNGTNRINSGAIQMTTTNLPTGQWVHMAFVKDGNTVNYYENGTKSSVSHSMTGRTIAPYNTPLGTFRIGGLVSGGYVDGYMDEVRISKVARYTANFTPSTTPFVNDADTLLLLHMDGTDGTTVFEDDNGVRAKAGVTAISNAQIDTAQSKFGGSSAVFDLNNGSGLVIDKNNAITGSGDYTIEMWVRPTTQDLFQALYDARTANPDVAPFLFWDSRGATTTLSYVINGTTIVVDTTTGLTEESWTHIAVTKSGSTVRLFIAGTLVDTGTDSSTLDVQNAYIGLTGFNNANAFNGHIDELRLSSIARYTANFTPATAPFQNDSNTLLLLHMDGTDGSTVFTDDNGVAPDHEY